MGEEIGDYYLGLDIGTSSVGWAVTDPEYNILNYRRKALWGIHLFEEGKTAEERRQHRCARRRLTRRKQRISLLRELFGKEIIKVDPGFFERLDESGLHEEDRRTRQPNSLFNDPAFTDKDFHSRFPTIYHLRKYLMYTDEKPDIRLVYLAIHHIIKYRGHFLFETTSDDIPRFEDVINTLIDDVCKYHMELSISDYDSVSKLVSDREKSIIDKKRELATLLGCNEPDEKELAALLSGSSANLGKLFSDEGLDKEKIKFSDSSADMRLEELEDILDSDSFNTLRTAKTVYDWGILSSLLRNHSTISEALVAAYDQHRKDLQTLKNAIRTHIPEHYKTMFKSKDTTANYCSYSGRGKPNKSCTQEEFCKYCLKLFDKTTAHDDPSLSDMFDRLEKYTYMPKQSSKDNAVLPHTVHKKELSKILNNASRFYPFLNEEGEDGFTTNQKILLLQQFRIPYYVGPLFKNDTNNAWVVKRSDQKITPWNFSDVVDEDASAQGFMDNLTGMCTYIVGEKVLPKNSILYSYFSLYNELNNVRVNGEKLDIKLKKDIVRDLFENSTKRVTEKGIIGYLVKRGLIDKKDTCEIQGINGEIKTTLRSLTILKDKIGDKIRDKSMCEEIIMTITVFGDPKRIEKNLSSKYGNKLTRDEIRELSRIRFEGWGRLSSKLLTGLRGKDPDTGIEDCVLGFMENTQRNLMEVLHECGFIEQIDRYNREMTTDTEVSYKTIESLQMSPAVKRAVWRTVRIVQDVVDRIGHPPAKVFVETTRGPMEKKSTTSRKNALIQLYKSCKENSEWLNGAESHTEAEFKSRSLYLYYTQLGRCMYCGKKIDFEKINDKSLVDLDHIYPQSLVKDDSIHNNLVLCHKECNMAKSNHFPLDDNIQMMQKPAWDELLRKKYITKEKYSRLIRKDAFTDDELARFISRQLVETSQSAKGSIEMLRRVLGEETDIVYVKAGMVSEFRQIMESPIMAKCRSVNDLHHAKDAYLNIIVGNVYDTKFTKNYRSFVDSGERYNIRRIYDYDVVRNGTVAWKAGSDGTRTTVLKNMRRNNILFTKMQFIEHGALFDDQLVRAKENSDALIERKKGMLPTKYGGYNKPTGACYSLIEYQNKGRLVRSLEVLPIFAIHHLDDNEKLEQFFSERIGTNVSIIIPVIRMNAMLEWGGVRVHLGGRTNDSILLYNAEQLLMDDAHYTYCKKLFKFGEDRKARIFHPVDYYGLTSKLNADLFDYLRNKIESEPYCRLPTASSFIKNLDSVNNVFLSEDETTQAVFLNEILHTFQCNNTSTDLKGLGGPGTTGRNVVNKKLPDGNAKKVYLINQSITGIMENKTLLN